ncbi:MAG: hypothetical protein L0K63_08915, partial [Yaniella sp.]|nr:hypothetical protein [Yaniella sp.]
MAETRGYLGQILVGALAAVLGTGIVAGVVALSRALLWIEFHHVPHFFVSGTRNTGAPAFKSPSTLCVGQNRSILTDNESYSYCLQDASMSGGLLAALIRDHEPPRAEINSPVSPSVRFRCCAFECETVNSCLTLIFARATATLSPWRIPASYFLLRARHPR